MRHQMNSILGKKDGIYQLSALTALRSLLPRFCDQRSRLGPFVLTLPDLHQSNIFVDDEWNVTRVIDLEFAPVYPMQMVNVPHWLNRQSVDDLVGPALDEYKSLYDAFVTIVEREEIAGQHTNTFSRKLREDWEKGRLWYALALSSINGFPIIFEQHLRPKFYEKFDLDTDGVALAQLWHENVFEFIESKLEDYQRYKEEVHRIFEVARAREIGETKATETEASDCDGDIGKKTNDDAVLAKSTKKDNSI